MKRSVVSTLVAGALWAVPLPGLAQTLPEQCRAGPATMGPGPQGMPGVPMPGMPMPGMPPGMFIPGLRACSERC